MLLSAVLAPVVAFGAVYWLLHPFLLGRRASLGSAVVAAVAAFGLMFLPWRGRPFGVALRQRGLGVLRSYDAALEEAREARRKASRRRDVAARFTVLPAFYPTAAPESGWTAGEAAGRRAWLDSASGLLWAEALELRLPDYSDASWRRAAQACREAEPAGAWALPTTAEFLDARMNGFLDAVPDAAARRWYAVLYVEGMSAELMGLFSTSSSNAGASPEYGVRCVGRTEAAPPNGILELTPSKAVSALNGGKR